MQTGVPLKFLIRCCISGFLLTGIWHESLSQNTFEENIPTENIDRKKDSNTRKNRNKQGIREIYKKRTWKIGYGNPCIEEATQKMGFIYAPVVKTQPGYTSEFKRNWHNWWVKLGLFFRRGPWWKLKIKKQIKDCRRKSGDIVGP